MNEKVMEQFLGELSNSSEHTRKDRSFYASKFLSFAEGRPFSEWDKSLVNEFIEQLRKEGYSPSTIRTIYGIVKRVFDSAKATHDQEKARVIAGVDATDLQAVAQILKVMAEPGPNWDLGKRAAPKLEGLVKPAATYDEIEVMVGMAKAGKLEPDETAYLALSTIYGLRREELCRVRREHFDFRKRTIFVDTVKGGEKRNQYLCAEIVPYLKEYDFTPYTSFGMSSLYYRICAKCGLVDDKGKTQYNGGWHQFRRYVDTTLIDIFGELWAHIFLRWRLSSSPLMVERYYSVEPVAVDRAILTGVIPDVMVRVPPGAQHPVVALWR